MGRGLAVLVAVTAFSARAWHVTPIPLWHLVEQSSVVVLAHVDAADAESLQLTVHESWRGQPPTTLTVANLFLSGFGDIAGKNVIVFLSSGERGWRVVSFGEVGVRSVGDDQLIAPMRELVTSAVALQSTLPPKSPPPMEWVALAFTHRLTREDGREMYVPIGDGTIPRELAARVADSFLESPTDDALLVAYLELTRADRRDQLTKAFAKSLDGLVADDVPAVWAIHAIDEFEVRITPGMKPDPRRSREDVADFFVKSRKDANRKIRAMWAKVKSKWRAKR